MRHVQIERQQLDAIVGELRKDTGLHDPKTDVRTLISHRGLMLCEEARPGVRIDDDVLFFPEGLTPDRALELLTKPFAQWLLDDEGFEADADDVRHLCYAIMRMWPGPTQDTKTDPGFRKCEPTPPNGVRRAG